MSDSTETSERWTYLSQLSFNYFGWAFCWNVATAYLVPNTLLRIVDDSVKNTRLGIMSGVSNVLVIALIPLVGVFSDRSRFRLGRRRPFYITASFAMCALIVMVAPSNHYFLLLSLLVLMHGALALWFPNRALIRDIVPLQRRGRISGLSNITNTLGIMMAHIVSPGFIESGRMLTLAAIAAGVNVVSNLWVALGIKEKPVGAPVRNMSSWVEAYIPKLSGPTKLGWLAAFNLFTQMGLVAMICFLLYFIKDQIDPVHFNTTFAKVVLIAMSSAIPSSLGAGFVADRFGRRRVLFIACLLQVACILNFLFSPRMHSTLYLSGFLYGLGNGAYLSMYWTVLSDMVPESEVSKFIGLMQYTFLIPWAVVPPTLGPIVDGFGAQSGHGYDILFAVIAAMLITGVFLIRQIPETLRRPASPASAGVP